MVRNRPSVFKSCPFSMSFSHLCVVSSILSHTDESEYQTDCDEDAVLSDFDFSNQNSEHTEEEDEEEEEETADTADTVR